MSAGCRAKTTGCAGVPKVPLISSVPPAGLPVFLSAHTRRITRGTAFLAATATSAVTSMAVPSRIALRAGLPGHLSHSPRMRSHDSALSTMAILATDSTVDARIACEDALASRP